MRISTLSMFQTGVMPKWEDPANATGGEYHIRFALSDSSHETSIDKLNTIWEACVFDLISNRFPHAD